MQGKFDRRVLPITTAVAAALLASGCGSRGEDRASSDVAVCRDRSGRRVDDADCAGGGSGGGSAGARGWYYLARGSRVPAIGEALGGGSDRPRAGVHYARASAATVTRGGFGMSAHGSGG
ncbi:hypothetical protein CLG96_06335 [Sphingomonas oleivorans]|uniref:Lipoprotein n=1 Tax=Sphingomonas oleivorans TaxID=1735121 RepID=A0A2T5FZP3_9SPHN|nr:hypothetical protein [Sphingomonas oleivorans]PTQ12170.1 hypothetical protein CLG96_06335 [Sphingomonas oleivorans]